MLLSGCTATSIGRVPVEPEQPFEKRLLLDVSDLGEISDLRIVGAGSADGARLMVAGQRGVAAFDDSLARSDILTLPSQGPEGRRNRYPSASHFVMNRDGSVRGVLRVAGAARSNDSYWKLDGQLVWQDDFAPRKTIAGDLDNDGVPEFVQVDMDYVRVFREDKSLVWDHAWNTETDSLISDVAILNSAHSDVIQPMVVVVSNGRLVGFNKEGRQVLDVDPARIEFFADLASMPCGDGLAGDCVLIYKHYGLQMFSPDGVERMTSEGVPYFYRVPYLDGVRVHRMNSDLDDEPLVVITGRILDQGGQWFGLAGIYTRLSVFRQPGELVFEDVLEDEGGGIAIVPDGMFQTRGGIALGDRGKVWIYEPRVKP